MPSTTNFIGSDGIDVGSKLLEKEYFNRVYLNIANQYITPELWVWGYNYYGQLGNNTSVNGSTPVTTSVGGANWKQVSCGTFNTAAIKTDGTLWTWGVNTRGELGDNTRINKSTPVTTFAGGTNWKQVSFSAGGYMAAVKTDGTLWVWGFNSQGQLGNNIAINNLSEDKLTPVTTFAGGNNWKQVSCGRYRTVAAIKTDGTLWTWGDNTNGSVGDNTNATRCTPVTTFAGGNNWKQVSSGGNGLMSAIKNDGTLWVWGNNSSGALGINDNRTTAHRSTPVTTFAGGTNWKQSSSGASSIFAIKNDGTLWAWGSVGLGNLGINSFDYDRSTPVTTFAGGSNWKQVSGGLNHAAAIKTDGTLWTWGDNQYGQLGFNPPGYPVSATPVTTFAGGNNWKQVSSVYNHVAAIRSYDEY